MPYILAGYSGLGNVAMLAKEAVQAKQSAAAAVAAGILSQADADAFIKAYDEYVIAQKAYSSKFFAAKNKFIRGLSVSGVYAGVLIGPATGGVSLDYLKRREPEKHAKVMAEIDRIAGEKARQECGPPPRKPVLPVLEQQVRIDTQGGGDDGTPKSDNTMLFIGLGVAAAAFFYMRSRQ